MVIVGTYCGNLIAFLTVTKYNPPFNTVKEMLQLRDDYKWGTLGGTIWELIFTQVPPMERNKVFTTLPCRRRRNKTESMLVLPFVHSTVCISRVINKLKPTSKNL